ncbi:hypothetical protein KY285_004936 [Solanum tuberosum]|nr:hypothetical protein KY285_004936 [Solanum tuberosum]
MEGKSFGNVIWSVLGRPTAGYNFPFLRIGISDSWCGIYMSIIVGYGLDWSDLLIALGLGILAMIFGWSVILFLADSPLFVPLFKSIAICSRGSSPPLLTAWLKSMATLTSIQVFGHIYTWFKSTIFTSLGSSPRLLQISVQFLDLPSSIGSSVEPLSVLDEL